MDVTVRKVQLNGLLRHGKVSSSATQSLYASLELSLFDIYLYVDLCQPLYMFMNN